MATTLELKGIHHLTAVTAHVRENVRFYTHVMGMRLVKRSVNQDDVSAYHLFYADAIGTPGTDLTFFDWEMPRERRGTHSITRTFLRVNGMKALEWWLKRLKENGVATSAIIDRDGRATFQFEDPEGQRLALIDDDGRGDAPQPWKRSPVPEEYQIRGLGPILMSVPDIERTRAVLINALNMREVRTYVLDDSKHTVVVFEMGGNGAHNELHVAIEPNLSPARLGAGGVHHVAFRTPSEEEHYAWIDRLDSLGISNTGRVDRYYFRSLYFREPSGVLFEIATDGPGFAIDEEPATLGEKLALPPFLEPQRRAIEAKLKPID